MKKNPHFLVHSLIDEKAITHSVGMPEYSYFFVMRDFIPLLKRIGTVTTLKSPEVEADGLFRESLAADIPCVFLNFTAPHNFIHTLSCPTIHVFAWEFDTIPTDTWLEDGRQDWRVALRSHKSSITHSEYAKSAILGAMGDEYPVAVIPSPIWDNVQKSCNQSASRSPIKSADIHFHGRIFDTQHIELFMDIEALRSKKLLSEDKLEPEHESETIDAAPHGLHTFLKQLIPPILWNAMSARDNNIRHQYSVNPNQPSANEQTSHTQERPNTLTLNGVVYTSIFNPLDGRKNWQDMVSAFVWAHKTHSDATLIIKTPKLNAGDFVEPLIDFLTRFQPFDCRVIILKAFLTDEELGALRDASSFYVNTSFGEGQCLPLMEYLSAGIPAVAPATTALADYINKDIAFVVPAHAEPSTWQHDPRLSYRTVRYRVDWLELVNAFSASYFQALNNEEDWRAMGNAAIKKMEHHCSLVGGEKAMRSFLERSLGWTL